MKIFWEKGAWAYPGTAQFFRVPPIIPGTRKATGFKFSQYIQSLRGSIRIKAHEKFRKKGAWAYPGTAQFFLIPLLSQERGKLRISNFASTLGSIGTKAH